MSGTTGGAVSTTVAGEAVELLPDKAVWWPARKTLILADLHWGKDESFRAMGAPIPDGTLDRDLARLDALIAGHAPERLLVVGDLLHAWKGVSTDVRDRIAAWRAHGPDLVLVPGNHDRSIGKVVDAWRITLAEELLREGPFAFHHYPERFEGVFVWCGHLHPSVVIGLRKPRFRIPCFHLAGGVGVLPAFGGFTGTAPIERTNAPDERVFAIAEDRVVQV